MPHDLAAFGPWPFVANTWFVTAVAAAALLAFLRHSRLARPFVQARDVAAAPSRFERFWSRRNGRLLAVGWIALVALTIGDGGLVWTETWEPVRVFFAILQPVAGALLVPMTAGLYLYKRSIPQVARDESDEREREIQGGVYRSVHAILLGAMLIVAGLVVYNPNLAGMVGARAQGIEPIDVIIPAFLVLYMLPSVAYAWMLPHREVEAADDGLAGPRMVNGEAA